MNRILSLTLGCLLLTAVAHAQSTTDSIRQAVNALLHEVEPDGYTHHLLHSEANVAEVRLEDGKLTLRFEAPMAFFENDLDDELHDELVETLTGALAHVDYTELDLTAYNSDGDELPLSIFFDKKWVAPLADATPESYDATSTMRLNPNAMREKSANERFPNDAQPRGQLEGKTVWLSAGHGWQYDHRRKTFNTQRHNHHGLVEDFGNIEAVNYYLLKYLYQSGANVWTVRERDMNENEVIIDNDQGAPDYTETGLWTTSKSRGYKNSSYRYMWSTESEAGAAIYTPDIPESGMYWVSVHYLASNNRAIDTRYRIHHAGGTSVVSINQKLHGSTWVYLGQFYFDKGRKGRVELLNQSSIAGQAVIADAVRFGGGKGDVTDCEAGKTSGEPRFEEAAKYYAKYQGFPDCETDISVRPRYAEWELAKGAPEDKQNAVYVSWHSNAGGATGTETFTHSYNASWKSRSLQSFIHDELVGDIRKGWDRNWRDRGKKKANFGELRGLRYMPGVLLEIGFHDHKEDSEALTTPQFRELAARAVYKGIVRYYAARDQRTPVFLPERPTHLLARNVGNNSITLTWKAPKHGGHLGGKATGYKVYMGTHGRAFGNGVAVTGNTYTFRNLVPGQTYYFRIGATNAGGESFPSGVVSARVGADGTPEFLIVDGFDRVDRWGAPEVHEPMPAFYPLGKVRRVQPDRINTFDYMVDHAKAMTAAGVAFDGATNEAVTARQVTLQDYRGINWILGEESTTDHTLDRDEQRLLQGYLDNGGNLIISGSELAYHLDFKRGGRDFYRNYLKAEYKGDNAGTLTFRGATNSWLDGKVGTCSRVGCSAYLVDSPDFIEGRGGAQPILTYANGKTAGVAHKSRYGVVTYAFPLEMIDNQEVMNDVMTASVNYLIGTPTNVLPIPSLPTENRPIAGTEPKDPDPTSVPPANSNPRPTSPAATPPTTTSGTGSTSSDLVSIPDAFSSTLVISTRDTPRGKVYFHLYDSKDRMIYRRKWKHRRSKSKKIDLDFLPKGTYRYEFKTEHGQVQKGEVVKRR